MKKIKNIISTALSVLALGSTFASCTPEEDNHVAKAVRGAQSVLEFAADSPQGQVITVVSDAQWHVTAPDWITVDPATGSGTTEVTVIAADNTDSQGQLAPRKDTLIFSGNTKASRYIVIVKQEGDAYRGAEEVTVSQFAALKDESAAIINDATVAALTSAGFVITDGTTNVYVTAGNGEVAVGDVVSINAVKGSTNRMPVVSRLDKLTRKSSGAFTCPEPINLDETIAAYAAQAIEYVSATGTVDGGSLKYEVDGKNFEIKQFDAPEGMSMKDIDGHRVEIRGYTCGFMGEGVIALLTTELKDEGVAQVIYFSDDFEWLDAYTTATGAGDAVGSNDPSTTAPNIYSTADLEPLWGEFTTKGYDFINAKDGEAAFSRIADLNYKVVYLQKNYLKFGKTSYNAGIVLPSLKAIPASDDILIEFDWAWQVTGGMAPDIMTLSVESTNGTFAESGSNISAELESAQPKETPSAIEWQHVSIVLSGADASTVLTIRPTNVDTRVSNAARKQNRWYLDNIKITPANGGVTPPSHQTFFQDDFSWTEAIAAAAREAGTAVGKTVEGQGSDAPNIWNIAALAEAFEPVFTAKGYSDPNKDEKLIYLQDGYLKFSRTGGHNTALQLEVSALPDTPTDVLISFDYCMMVQGDGTIDAGPMGVYLIGDGEFENGTRLSDGLTSAQTTGQFRWNKSGDIKAKGVTNKTKFVFIMERALENGEFKWNVSGAGRFFIDNIVIRN